MIGSMLIFLREGIEGSMIVTLMCAYLAAVGRRDLFRPLFVGVAAALIVAGAIATALYLVVAEGFIDSAAQLWFETAAFLSAASILTYMTFWMKRQARHMNKALTARVAASVAGGSPVAVGLLAFVTVGREALETAIFLLALAFRESPADLLLGAAIGLGLALSLGIYCVGLHVNLSRFFTCVGAALLVVAAGLLANAIGNVQALHAFPGSGQVVWSTAAIMPEDSSLGDILHGVLGYTATPTVLQLSAWAFFVGVGLAAFLRPPSLRLARSWMGDQQDRGAV